MALYENRSLVLERGINRRPHRALWPVGKRVVALLLGTAEPGPRETPDGGSGPVPDPPDGRSVPAPGEAPTADHRLRGRFPLVMRGYNRTAVDDYVAELEQELFAVDRDLAALRGGGAVADEVASELKRLGEQTSAVLLTAHQQRDEILRKAQEQADRCVAEATATANALTAKCEQRLRELNAQNDAAQGERARLLEDLRTISTALVEVADSADARFSSEAALQS